MSEKSKGLLINLVLYIVVFGVAFIPFAQIENIFAAEAAFTVVATLLIFIVTCFFPDTSLYDPYWSVAPVVMLLAAMIKYNLWSANAILILCAVTVWAVTYKGVLHEDWRYRMFRENNSPLVFALINFAGLQFVPTIVVYAGLVGAFFLLQTEGFSLKILPGILVMLTGVALEYFSDRAVHRFLAENKGRNKTCNISLWKYSRHPNYLGEMTFWTGIFIAFVVECPDIWYYGLGFLAIVALFLFASIPMMEKHNEQRREDYAEYKEKTSVLFLLPPH